MRLTSSSRVFQHGLLRTGAAMALVIALANLSSVLRIHVHSPSSIEARGVDASGSGSTPGEIPAHECSICNLLGTLSFSCPSDAGIPVPVLAVGTVQVASDATPAVPSTRLRWSRAPPLLLSRPRI